MGILCQLLGGGLLFLDHQEEDSSDLHGKISGTKFVNVLLDVLDLLGGSGPKSIWRDGQRQLTYGFLSLAMKHSRGPLDSSGEGSELGLCSEMGSKVIS